MRAVADIFKANRKFFLATHINPDGDAIGSSVALAMALKAMGKEVTVYDRDGVPENCTFLPGMDMVTDMVSVQDTSEAVLVLLDCNTPVRAGLDESISFKTSVVIDHHQTESPFGQVRWVEPLEAATGVMVYRLLVSLEAAITRDIAINLYAAIAIDTGVFRYGNTSGEVLEIAASLVRAGAVPAEITDHLYNSWSANRYRLFSLVQGSLEIHGSVALSMVTLDMFDVTNTGSGDTETFVNQPLVMGSVMVSALIKQKDKGLWKVSLRSKGNIDISPVAVKFNGGGHKNASGCSLEGDIKRVKQQLLDALKDVIR